MDEPDVLRRELPNSGRSTQSIINLANYLIHWTRLEHPNLSLRGALNLPEIHPTPAGDPQPNPHDRPECIHLFGKKFKPDDELRTIVGSVKNWLRDHPDETAAVLVPRNERGARLVEGLKSAGVEVVELLRSSLSTRQTAGLLTAALRCLADPSNQQKLASLYIELTRPDDQDNPEYKAFVQAVAKMLRKCSRLEEFLYPRPDQDWLADQQAQGVDESVIAELETLREKMVRWHTAALLPIDQLILTIAQDAFYTPAELALAHKLALVMERTAQSHPEWHLEEFTDELDNVARNRRKFLGFAEEDTGFDPDQHKGKVAVATVHKAKGLEWDRVYLMSVNNYDFPSGDEYDQFMSEKYFVRNRLNLPEECLMRLKALMSGDLPGVYLEEGEATLAARSDYAAERLRLLYVAITRARKELVLTWNHGKNNDCLQARPFIALQAYWEQTTDVPQP
jgi:DNA helicase-2/ATP-dependent DNA helicase PcrA